MGDPSSAAGSSVRDLLMRRRVTPAVVANVTAKPVSKRVMVAAIQAAPSSQPSPNERTAPQPLPAGDLDVDSGGEEMIEDVNSVNKDSASKAKRKKNVDEEVVVDNGVTVCITLSDGTIVCTSTAAQFNWSLNCGYSNCTGQLESGPDHPPVVLRWHHQVLRSEKQQEE